jgi:hypothetical protein
MYYFDIDLWKYQFYFEYDDNEIQLFPVINLKLSGWMQRKYKPLVISLAVGWLFFSAFVSYAEDRELL